MLPVQQKARSPDGMRTYEAVGHAALRLPRLLDT